MVKNLLANAGDTGCTPESGRPPGGGNGNPLQYSCLENPRGQRSLVGHCAIGHKESDMTAVLSMHAQVNTLSAVMQENGSKELNSETSPELLN